MNKIRIKLLMVVVLAFTVGWAGSTLSNGYPNVGLVTALSSVMSNLLGEGAAGASVTDVEEMPGVQLDVRAYPTIPNAPVVYNLFRGDSCQTFAQVRVVPGGTSFIIDPDLVPVEFNRNVVVEYGLSEAFPPGPCLPPSPIIPGGDG